MRSLAFIAILLILGSALPALADSPTTQPTTQPVSADRSTFVREQYENLAHIDPEMRDQARIALMGISRAELKALSSIVRETRPVLPSQSMVLHDIVLHAFLSTEPFEETTSGFAGIQWSSLQQGDTFAMRLPGFIAYRMLQEGDVVTGMREATKGVPFDTNVLRRVLRNLSPGDVAHLYVIRRGRAREIPIKLDARPSDLELGNIPFETFHFPRLNQAEEFWLKEFQPMLENSSL